MIANERERECECEDGKQKVCKCLACLLGLQMEFLSCLLLESKLLFRIFFSLLAKKITKKKKTSNALLALLEMLILFKQTQLEINAQTTL